MKKHKGIIPDIVLGDILKVYEFGLEEYAKRNYPNDYVASNVFDEKTGKFEYVIWTTWTEIFRIKDTLENHKKMVAGENETSKPGD